VGAGETFLGGGLIFKFNLFVFLGFIFAFFNGAIASPTTSLVVLPFPSLSSSFFWA